MLTYYLRESLITGICNKMTQKGLAPLCPISWNPFPQPRHFIRIGYYILLHNLLKKQDLLKQCKSYSFWDGVFIEVHTFCPCGRVAGDQAAILFSVHLCYSSSRSLNINRVLSFRGCLIRSSRSSSSLGGFV